jgi:hypothetical protein
VLVIVAVTAANPFGAWPGGLTVKPEDPRSECSSDPAPDDTAAHPAEVGSLWEQFLARGNLAEALRRVEQNAGAAGIDGMSTEELRPWLKDHWPEVRSQLDAGTYRPQPVRRVMIPKPSGGLRKLGVPAAVDRLICQAIAQVLTPYGNRVGARAAYLDKWAIHLAPLDSVWALIMRPIQW